MVTPWSGVSQTQLGRDVLNEFQPSTLPFVAFRLRTVSELDSDVAQCRSDLAVKARGKTDRISRPSVSATHPRSVIQLAEELATAHEHAVLAGRAPFQFDEVAVFARVARHFDGDFARCDGTAMEQADAEAADFASHRGNRTAS